MVRKCSQCGMIGHNSRTCTTYKGANSSGLRLFGVQLFDNVHSSSSSIISIKKSFSLNCLDSSSSSSQASSTNSSRINYIGGEITHKTSIGYLSDCPLGRPQERKKGVPWTEKEHGSFLRGLEKLGKGDWRGISRHFVQTRTPTQVASHAQKFFLRQTSIHCKRRRSSLFDMTGSGSGSKEDYHTSSVPSGTSEKIERTDHNEEGEEDTNISDNNYYPRKKQWHDEDDGKASEKIINFVRSSAIIAATETKEINSISSNNTGVGAVAVAVAVAPPPDLELTLSMAAAAAAPQKVVVSQGKPIPPPSSNILSGSIISVN